MVKGAYGWIFPSVVRKLVSNQLSPHKVVIKNLFPTLRKGGGEEGGRRGRGEGPYFTLQDMCLDRPPAHALN